MSREKDFAKNTVILGLGRFLPKLVSLVTLPIVTANLTKAEYGVYDLLVTLVSLLIPVATLQIQSAAFRFLIDHRKDEQRKGEIISGIYAVSAPIAAIISVGIAIYFEDVSMTSRVLIGLYFLLDTFYQTTSQCIRGLGANKDYAIASVLVSVIDGVGIVLGVQLAKRGLEGVLLAVVIAHFVATVFMMLRTNVFRYLRITQVKGAAIKEMLAYSWPMVPNNLSTWVLKLSDRLVITAFLGIEANAVYAVANKIPNLLNIAQQVMVMAWHENASIAVKDPDADKYYSSMFDRIFCLLVGCTAILIACTPIMFWLLIRGDYDDAYIQIPILIMGTFFFTISSFQGGIYIAHKRTKNVGVTTMVAAAINLIIDLLFVNVIGVTAGSVSTLTAYFVLFVYRAIDVKKFQPIRYNVRKIIGLLAIIAAMLILCSLRIMWVDVLNIVMGILIFYIINRTFIKGVLNKVLMMRKH